jgi:hypothetical protein
MNTINPDIVHLIAGRLRTCDIMSLRRVSKMFSIIPAPKFWICKTYRLRTYRRGDESVEVSTDPINGYHSNAHREISFGRVDPTIIGDKDIPRFTRILGSYAWRARVLKEIPAIPFTNMSRKLKNIVKTAILADDSVDYYNSVILSIGGKYHALPYEIGHKLAHYVTILIHFQRNLNPPRPQMTYQQGRGGATACGRKRW